MALKADDERNKRLPMTCAERGEGDGDFIPNQTPILGFRLGIGM